MYNTSRNPSMLELEPESPILSNFSEGELNDIFKGFKLSKTSKAPSLVDLKTKQDDLPPLPLPPPPPEKDIYLLNEEVIKTNETTVHVFREAQKLLDNIRHKHDRQEYIFGREAEPCDVIHQELKWEKLRELWLKPSNDKKKKLQNQVYRCSDSILNQSNLSLLSVKSTPINSQRISAPILKSKENDELDKPLVLKKLGKFKKMMFTNKIVNKITNNNEVEPQPQPLPELPTIKEPENKSPLDFETIEEWQYWYNSLSDKLKYSFYKQITNPKNKVKKSIPLSIAMTNLMFGWKVEGLCDPPSNI